MYANSTDCDLAKLLTSAVAKLADRTAATTQSAPPPPSSPHASIASKERASTPTKAKAASPKESEQTPNDLVIRLRTDLATTQKARAGLQAQFDELSTSLKTLELQSKVSNSQNAQLSQQKAAIERRLRDRDEELKGKSKLVEQAQDEMVALGLQLHMSENKSEKLTRENKELVDRWMKRMADEAERVNRESEWR